LGCKSSYNDVITIMYDSKYENQYMHVVDVVKDEVSAKDLAMTYFSMWYKDLNVDFTRYDTINISLSDDNEIWRIKMVRSEKLRGNNNPKYDVANYFVFIRKKDGAMLYSRREVGEWVGTIDMYEKLYNDRNGKDNNGR